MPSPVRGTHASRRAATRARVFEAAIECLHDGGYAASSTLAVAKHAGLSRGAVQKQFATKASLFSALVAKLLSDAREELRANLVDFEPGLERVMARMDFLWEHYKKPSAYAVMEILLGARSDKELSRRLAKVGRERNRIEERLLGEDFEAMGIADRQAAGIAAFQMLVAVRGLALERVLTKNRKALEGAFALQRRQTEAIFRSLMVPAAENESDAEATA